MSESENSPPALPDVMIRRGTRVVRGISTKMLIPYIESRKLLPSDEISLDGIKWVRLDQHRRLASYFSEEKTTRVLPEPPAVFPQDAEAEDSKEMAPQPGESDDAPSSLPEPPGMQDELSRLAEILKDLNE